MLELHTPIAATQSMTATACGGASRTRHERRAMRWLAQWAHIARGALGSSAIFGALAFGAAPARDMLRGEVAAQIDPRLRSAPWVRDRDSLCGREQDQACRRGERAELPLAASSRGEGR